MVEEYLFIDCQETAQQARHDDNVEESFILALLAEQNADEMARSVVSWGCEDESDILTTTTYSSSSLTCSSSSLDDITVTNNSQDGHSISSLFEAEVHVTSFLKFNKDALINLSNHLQPTQTDFDSQSALSTIREADEAVLTAEKVAQGMENEIKNWTNAGQDIENRNADKWVQYWSEEHAREYYHQPSTGKVVWELPMEVSDVNICERNTSQEKKMTYEVQNWSLDGFLRDEEPKKKKRKKKKSSRGSKGINKVILEEGKVQNLSLDGFLPEKESAISKSENKRSTRSKKKTSKRSQSFWNIFQWKF